MSHATTQQHIEKQVSRSLVALIIRQVLAYGSIFLGNVYLSRHLAVDEYGFFATVLAFQAALIVLGDLGLGPALVQREKAPTEDELVTLFTVQLLLFSLLALGIWFLAPWFTEIEHREESINVIRALAIILCITAWRSISAMQLERNLRFDAIAFAEVVSTVLYQAVLVGLVWYGLGITSIVWALAARYSSDLLIILYFCPWRPKRLSLNVRLIWPYLRFGLEMQGIRLMAYAKDQLPLLFLVPMLGLSSAGEWGWALAYIGIPVYLNRAVDRIMFPAYSRVQHDREAVGNLAATALWLNFAMGLPILLVLIIFASWLIPLIYESNWLVTLPIIIGLAPNMMGGFFNGSVFPILYATGQPKKALKLFALWVTLTLIGSLIGIPLAQLPGLATAYSVATLVISVVLWHLVYSVAPFSVWQALSTPFMAAIGAVVGSWLVLLAGAPWYIGLILFVGLYCVLIVRFGHEKINLFAKNIL